jgi:hypothetical protein
LGKLKTETFIELNSRYISVSGITEEQPFMKLRPKCSSTIEFAMEESFLEQPKIQNAAEDGDKF